MQNTTITGHVVKPGHRCYNPIARAVRARNIKLGEILQIGDWELFYRDGFYYVVEPIWSSTAPVYSFKNFNCAGAKLAELGRA